VGNSYRLAMVGPVAADPRRGSSRRRKRGHGYGGLPPPLSLREQTPASPSRTLLMVAHAHILPHGNLQEFACKRAVSGAFGAKLRKLLPDVYPIHGLVVNGTVQPAIRCFGP